MGTTAQKLQRVLDTKEGLKDTINTYLGQDITSAIPFKDYETYIKNFYGSLPKTSYAEGSNITLSNTLKGKLDFENGVVGIGQSSQESTTGINLCEAKMATATWHGVTFKNNGDGTFTINGTNDYAGNITFRINQSAYGQADNLQNYEDGDYTLDIGVSNSGMQATLMQNSTWHVYLQTPANARLVSGAISGATNTFIYIAVPQGATINNVTIKPMLVKGSYTESTIPPFEQYTGGQASPNPSYPQEIEVVRGKNKWGGFSPFTKTQGGLTFTTNTDGSIDISGTATEICTSSTVAEAIANNLFIKLEKGTYTVSGGGSNHVIQIYDKNANIIANTQLGTTSVTFTLTQTTEIMCRVFIDSGGTQFNTKAQVQLESGSVATSYLPYNTLEVVVRGKNLFDGDVEQGAINSTAGETYAQVKTNNTTRIRTKDLIALNKNETYTISCKSGYNVVIQAFNDNKTLYVTSGTNAWVSSVTFTNIPYIAVAIKKTSEANITPEEIVNAEAQLETGSTATTYEPYITPTSYQLSLGDIELNAIGTYKDELVYDADEDKVYKNKNVNKIALNTLAWETASVGTNSYGTRILMSSIGKVATDINIISSHAKGIIFNDRNAYLGTSIYDETNGYVVFRNTSFTSLEDFTTFLNNNNVYAYYVLATATREEITGTLKDQIKDIYNLMSYTGTTILEVDGDLPLIIKTRALKGE